jgi:hypothetical protein
MWPILPNISFCFLNLNEMHWTWPNIEIIDRKVILEFLNFWSEQILIDKINILFSL